MLTDFSTGSNLPLYHCRRIAHPFTPDGDLTKPVWQEIEAVQLVEVQSGRAPAQGTRVRGCWDGTVLYLAFDCIDCDIRATMTRRDDRVWQEEAVEAFIAPYGDLVHYFEFQCNPINTLNDVRVTNPNARGDPVSFDRSWTCEGWQSAVSISGKVNAPGYASHGWSAEWAIPLSALLEPGAGPVQPGDEWRLGLFRIDRWPSEEYSAWSPNPIQPLSFHRPRFFGRWVFD